MGPGGFIKLPRCRCREAIKLSRAQLCSYVICLFPEVVSTLKEKWEGQKEKFSYPYKHGDVFHTCKHPVWQLVRQHWMLYNIQCCGAATF